MSHHATQFDYYWGRMASEYHPLMDAIKYLMNEAKGSNNLQRIIAQMVMKAIKEFKLNTAVGVDLWEAGFPKALTPQLAEWLAETLNGIESQMAWPASLLINTITLMGNCSHAYAV